MPSFAVHPTSHYKRLATKLQKTNRDFAEIERSAVAVLSADPYNRPRSHNIATPLLRPSQGRHVSASTTILNALKPAQ